MVMGFNRKTLNNMCLKIDLHKAYDRINGNFIHDMLICMVLPHNRANLIFECISSASFSLPINGSPYGMIASNKGLRQGDLLSPYLFRNCYGISYNFVKY